MRYLLFSILILPSLALAEKNMHDKESELDYTKAAAQLAEAAARIKTIQKLRKNK